ncbi:MULTISPECIES: hypothetical protein [unclassified Wolbachia]|nr:MULTISPECIES: hypothetical protein [unclassified Wolbachia]UFO00806.1 hypothetical protein LOK48_02395 [Wolbachia endosymbiont of Corcyra cephalonica]
MLQNQLCENINIDDEDFSILDATVVDNVYNLAAYFNSIAFLIVVRTG